MSIWNKVLVGLIAVASLVLFYMASRALQIHTYWSSLAMKYEEKLEGPNGLLEANQKLAEGDPMMKEDGIRQLKVKLHNLLVDRRRMWSDCVPKVTFDAKGALTVALTLQKPNHGIVKSMVLYAFEAPGGKKKKGQYLGEFSVKSIAGKQATLVPTGNLTQREIAAMGSLAKSSNSWTLYEILPRDNHEIFNLVDDAWKKSMLPAESLREYLRDGKPAEKDDPQDCIVDGKYVRPLHDYLVLFNSAREMQGLLTDSYRAAKQAKELMDSALALARDQEDACKREVARVMGELKKMAYERDAVKKFGDKLDSQVAAMQAWIDKLTKKNQAMAGQIAKYQLEAAERINQRTRAMAQSGVGGS